VNTVQDLGSLLGALALTVPRIAAAFLVLPLLSSASMPALVRNSFFVSLAIFIYPVAASAPALAAPAIWPLIVLKELFIGASLGFLFGAVFWAVSSAGNLIDSKVGSNLAAVLDPIQGRDTSITGQLLSQLAAWLFMASGAFTLFLELLMTSYTIWPVTRMLPPLAPAGRDLMIEQFEAVLATTLMLAAPALVILSLIDLCLGLVNRYAPQLNVFPLTLSIKAWTATWIVLLTLGTFVEVLMRRLADSRGLLQVLRGVL
jgi:type III secretion protein T